MSAPGDDGSLHQFGVFEKNIDYCLFRRVVIGVKPKFGKAFVLTNHFLGTFRYKIDDSPKVFAAQRRFEVFNDIELDVALAQYVDCAA